MNGKGYLIPANTQFVADSNSPGWFGAFIVDKNLSALDRFCSRRPCLEESCCPQPFVNPDIVVISWHVKTVRIYEIEPLVVFKGTLNRTTTHAKTIIVVASAEK